MRNDYWFFIRRGGSGVRTYHLEKMVPKRLEIGVEGEENTSISSVL